MHSASACRGFARCLIARSFPDVRAWQPREDEEGCSLSASTRASGVRRGTVGGPSFSSSAPEARWRLEDVDLRSGEATR